MRLIEPASANAAPRNIVGIGEPVGFESRFLDKKKAQKPQRFQGLIGERVGIRTRDPLIKSQMLYQLSYAPVK